MNNLSSKSPDLICLSHLRWDFVFQRPQHLMTRFAKQGRVFYVEEPVLSEKEGMECTQRESGIYVIVPHVRPDAASQNISGKLARMLSEFMCNYAINSYYLWYYTPMAMAWTAHLNPIATVYDCMDELSAFQGAPSDLKLREQELFQRADLVFTGGYSLFDAKRSQHPNVYAFPSSIDISHFARARSTNMEPADQAHLPRPRIGYCGVVDERMDLDLLAGISQLRPDWQLVMIGPVAKISHTLLPKSDNIHYLGMKSYDELPLYMSGWNVAILPFARNESTRFISPTKTPEYLAAGKPVVSTPIADVVRPYGISGFVRIAETPDEFVFAIEEALDPGRDSGLQRVDDFLSQTSWSQTWGRMAELLEDASRKSKPKAAMAYSAVAGRV
jgi:UDP-galactopyranose mutase